MSFENVSENRNEWVNYRKTKVGSSDICTIVGLNPFKSVLELWAEKTGKTDPQPESPAMRYGRAVESAIADLFADEHIDYKIRRNDTTYEHPDYSWAIATPDYFFQPPERASSGVLEIKHSSITSDWDEGAPNYAHTQLQWQMGVLGVDYGRIAAVVGSRANDLKTPSFDFESSIFEQLMDKARQFIEFVESDTPPDPGPGDKKAVKELVDQGITRAGVDVQISAYQIADLREQKKQISRQIKELSDQITALENNLVLTLGADTTLELDDGRFLKCKKQSRKEYTMPASEFWRVSINGKK